MMVITREIAREVQEATGEGLLASVQALKKTDGDVKRAVDYLHRCGTLVAHRQKVNAMELLRLKFETMWRIRFEFEMKRGEGRASHGLKIDEATGKYISDKAQFAWEIWQEAKK